MKKKILFFTLILLQTISIRAQNHITNGGFETNTGFPSGPAQYALASGWNNCNGGGSPDYAHTSGTGSATLPNNYFGIVSPHSGNAVMGIILWHSIATSFREYISQMLSSPLVVGNTYNVSFYLTNGNSSGNYGGYGVDQVSIAFSTSPLVQTGSTPINFTPQFVFPAVFFDSTWQQVSFQFTADSAYNYLTFGNFKPDANTISQFYRTESIQAGYYFIDDIVVVDSSNTPPPVISFSASDSSFCGKQCIDFTDLSTNSPTSWQWLFPGADSISSQLQHPTGICYSSFGSFDVTLIACNAGGCDTLHIQNLINEYANPSVPAVTGNYDTLFCSLAYAYQWYYNSAVIPGATGQYYVFQQPGDYFVIITDSNGCATPSNVIYTGIDEDVDNGEIYVIPNPTDGNFILSGIPANARISISDVAGRLLYAGKINSSQDHINFEAPGGIYFLEIVVGEQLITRKKLLKN